MRRYFRQRASFLFPSSASAEIQPATQSLDGLWLTDGYGDLFELHGDNLRGYEITGLSCIESSRLTTVKGARNTGVGTASEVFFSRDDDTFRLFPASSPNTRWLHEDGSVSNILLRRTGPRPAPCGHACRTHRSRIIRFSGRLSPSIIRFSLYAR
jgi:hypothetical protein